MSELIEKDCNGAELREGDRVVYETDPPGVPFPGRVVRMGGPLVVDLTRGTETKQPDYLAIKWDDRSLCEPGSFVMYRDRLRRAE